MRQYYHKLATKTAEKCYWPKLHGAGVGLALANVNAPYPLLIITPDANTITQLVAELNFFLPPEQQSALLVFPDSETLPYDHFSPHENVISERLLALYNIPLLSHGIIIASINTLMQRLPPREYITANSFILRLGETLDLTSLRERLQNYGYNYVTKVIEHGEFAIRGSIIDLFPSGSKLPFRIDLFANEVESIRTFDPETQRSLAKIENIHLLPAKEYPLTAAAIQKFRQNWRESFSGDPLRSPIYQSISNHEAHPGIEYYLPLFFPQTATLFDYLPQPTTIVKIGNINSAATQFWQEIKERYEQLRHDQTRPLLPPSELFLPVEQLFAAIKELPQVTANSPDATTETDGEFVTAELPDVTIDFRATQPLARLTQLITNNVTARILFVVESAGRREAMLELLHALNIVPTAVAAWQEFSNATMQFAITIGAIERPLYLVATPNAPALLVITEAQIFGEQVVQQRASRTPQQDPEAIIRDLTELHIGAPVVHTEHGIGRYLGLQKLTVSGCENEFLVLEYAQAAKLYVPVSSLNLINRYTGIDSEHAPVHHLGNPQWEKTKKQAQEKIRDTAAELLEIYARRLSLQGYAFSFAVNEYNRFAAAFPFVTTPDQERAIQEVLYDMSITRPMDRLICGDVGFGKTEVAMRAAFVAVQNNKQVVVLTPTTLLAQQHLNNFQDRFADWPIRIALFSRFRTAKEQKNILTDLAAGKIDIVIGTHKLLQPTVTFKDLGLLVVDEEHRFGVKQKERIKEVKPNVDILTLTATPIPRTLNMAFANIRDFSIIATPPAKRLAIKTFVHQRDLYLIKEAVLREILRGGQVYFLHNDIATIEKTAGELQKLVPQAKIAFAHGQMREHQLEHVMRDFYHLHTNILVCTTIIESGIDVPTANTIIIDRADKLGLAQLHQLRGRVGRSHHQAYAYLLTPPEALLTPDAKKRLDAIASMEDLGAGFVLATHDLEIRGTGELLGEEQSGEIQNIGFSLYMEMLEQAVATLKAGLPLEGDISIKSTIDIDLQIPALLPDSYINDVNQRLVLYKRVANAKNSVELDELKVELIDRFGLLPEATKNLFQISELKLIASPLGIVKIVMGTKNGSIEFNAKPNIDPKAIIKLIQTQPQVYKIKGSSKLEFVISKSDVKSKIELVQALLAKFARVPN